MTTLNQTLSVLGPRPSAAVGDVMYTGGESLLCCFGELETVRSDIVSLFST